MCGSRVEAVPLRDLQDNTPGRMRRVGDTLDRSCEGILPGRLRNERQVDGSVEHALHVCCPGAHGGDRKELPCVDPGQADCRVGLHENEVTSRGRGVPRRSLEAVARGGSRSAGDDQGQAPGQDEVLCAALESDCCERQSTLYTGRFHALMQDELTGLPEGASLHAQGASTVSPQACAAAKKPRLQTHDFPALFLPGTGPCMLKWGGSSSEVDPGRQRGAGVWSSSSSAEQGPVPVALEGLTSIPISTWNLAGAGKKKVKGLVTTVFEHDIVAVQEYPKQSAGWHTVDHGRMNAVLYQDHMMYRAVGVMYDKYKFRFRKRRWSNRGVWVLLERHAGGQEVWVGSLHLPVNEVIEEVQRFIDQFLAALPDTQLPAVLLGDMNTHFRWRVRDGVAMPSKMHSRWSKLRQATTERGFSQVAPCTRDAAAPTFVPRRAGASGTQIDACFAARCRLTPLHVEQDSRHEIGTDHERVAAGLLLREGVRRNMSAAQHSGGPRKVVSDPPPQTVITEQVLQDLAAKHTQPASMGPRFRMSRHTRALQHEAKSTKTASAWKAYLASLRREKDEWKAERVERAAQNWGTYKQLCRKKSGWSEGYMLASQSETPEYDVVQHFTDVFHDARRPNTVSALHAMAAEIQVDSPPLFTAEEVREAFLAGKKCKAVGPDGVPLELLLALMNDECTLQSFVSYFNNILLSGETPGDWNKSVATLLPKILQPVQPKELRPIALASHTSKAFSRMLLNRVEHCLRPQGAKQLACKGRQPTDLVWSAVRMVHFAREWGAEMHMIKLDLRRAFDSVYRVELAKRVQAWCQAEFPAETRCLINLLAAADLVLALPWGCYDIHSNTGVNQGATESPSVFGRLIDEILSEIPLAPQHAVFPDLPSDGGCYMDDVLAWFNSIPALQHFLNALLPKLAAFGLFVQPLKCQLMSTRVVPGVHVNIEGQQLYPVPHGEPIMIMNLPVGLDATDVTSWSTCWTGPELRFIPSATSCVPGPPCAAGCESLRRWCLGSCPGWWERCFQADNCNNW